MAKNFPELIKKTSIMSIEIPKITDRISKEKFKTTEIKSKVPDTTEDFNKWSE